MRGFPTEVLRWTALAAVVVAAGLAGPGAAEISRTEPGPGEPLVLAREDFTGARSSGEIGIEVDGPSRRRILRAGRALIRDFPLPDRAPVDLRLTSFNLLAPGARFVSVNASGAREVPPPDLRTFRGTVEGEASSTVVLTFFDDRMAGFVRIWDREYIVGPDEFNPARTRSDRLWVRARRATPDGEPAFDCAQAVTPDLLTVVPRTPGARTAPTRYAGRDTGPSTTPTTEAITTIDGDTLLQATIAMDATVEFYNHFGSLTAAQNYILNLMAQISTVYENEVGVKLEVSYLRVFTADPDPYTDGSTSTSVLLADLRAEWTANQGGVPRTVAHLFSRRSSGGAGLAYLDVLCNGSYGYGVSTMTANGSGWEKDLVAHEIGHNFASPHTHCFQPEIDRCANQDGCYQGTTESIVGTIMSYCGQKQSVFHPRVKDEEIRPAAEDAYPACIDTAGLPGAVPGDAGAGLVLSKPIACPAAGLLNDDGSLDSYYGYGGTSRMAWIKRFTPTCYPFRLTRADVLIGHASTVFPGRPIRVLVYVDPAGSGDPGNATLVYSKDTTVQVVSSASFNEYAIDEPVVIAQGDYYVGFYDLLADPGDTFIGTRDSSVEGDAFRTAGSTSPGSFSPLTGGTWMIRAEGGAVTPGSVMFAWDLACNESTTPGQDYAIYRGTIGAYADRDSLTCSTSRVTSYLAQDVADGYFLVVPTTTANEGSYGLDGAGAERAAAANACKLQSFDVCQ